MSNKVILGFWESKEFWRIVEWRDDEMKKGNRIKASKLQRIIDKLKLKYKGY